MGRRVVVTGLGLLTPAGSTQKAFWKSSLLGRPGYDATEKYSKCPLVKSHVVGKVKPFDFMGSTTKLQQRAHMGRPAILAVNAALRAMRSAKLCPEKLDLSKAGVCIANAIADTPFSEKAYRFILKNEKEPDDLYEKGMFTSISQAVSKEFGFRGETLIMSTGCTGGIDAIGYGASSILSGRHEVMICGAAEAPLTAMTLASFDTIGALATEFNHDPQHASRPFDNRRCGFVLSEGCAIVVLEEFSHAKRRGAPIFGEIRGFASGNNALHMVSLPEHGEALAQVIGTALEQAHLKPADIHYINAHGSSTKKNDWFETDAYKLALGIHAKQIPISATKSITGHPLSAASAIGIVQSLLVFKYGYVPPTANYEDADPKCDLNYVTDGKQVFQGSTALVTASGFSGIHSAMVMSKCKDGGEG